MGGRESEVPHGGTAFSEVHTSHPAWRVQTRDFLGQKPHRKSLVIAACSEICLISSVL